MGHIFNALTILKNFCPNIQIDDPLDISSSTEKPKDKAPEFIETFPDTVSTL